jgi:ApeA N-terminal domain 1
MPDRLKSLTVASNKNTVDLTKTTDLPVHIDGRFWFTDIADVACSGTLTIAANHAYEVEFSVPAPHLNRGFSSEAHLRHTGITILGETEDGMPLTLADCGGLQSRMSYSGPNRIARQTLKFYANTVLLGRHVNTIETCRFKHFTAFFSGFNQWIGVPGREYFAFPEKQQSLILREDRISDFGNIQIYCHATDQHTGRADISEETKTRYWQPYFEPSSPVTLKDMLDNVILFQRLMCLLQRGPVKWDQFTAEVED